jgi:hypothetical protein
MLTKMHVLDLIDYARELGERFPDLLDHDVLESCEEYSGRAIHTNSVLWLRIRDAYVKGTTTGGRYQ